MIQRTFEYVPKGGGDLRTVTATVDYPKPVGTSWGAVLRIEGLNQSYEKAIMGIDGFQAVLGAIGLVPAVIGTMLEGGTLTFLGKTDLDCRTPDGLG
jgi:hypothetical protein